MSFAERIAIKSRREIEQMREVGRKTAEILLELRRPGPAGRHDGASSTRSLAAKPSKRGG